MLVSQAESISAEAEDIALRLRIHKRLRHTPQDWSTNGALLLSQPSHNWIKKLPLAASSRTMLSESHVKKHWRDCNASQGTRAFLIAQSVKNPSAMQETLVWFLVREDLLEKDRLPTLVFLGFPCGSAGKESVHNAGDLAESGSCCHSYCFQNHEVSATICSRNTLNSTSFPV